MAREFSDKELVALCLEKNPNAWATFVERHSRLIFWAIRDRLMRWGIDYNEEDSKDIFQNVVVSLWEKGKFAQIRNRKNIIPWLIMVSGNAAFDYFRGKNPNYHVVSVPGNPGFLNENGSEAHQMHLSERESPREILRRKELRQTVEDAINSLSDEHRVVITLRLLYGKKQKEIAGILKLSINTVSTIISRTRKKLKNELEARKIEDF